MLFIHPLFLIFTAGLFCILFLLYFFRALSLKIELKQSLKLNSNQKNDIWDSKEDLEIVSVIEESHDIKSFVLRRKNGKNIPLFHPGQFVSFQVGNSLKDIRSYSISSSPLHPYQFQVSVKKINNGLGSTFFHQLKTGDSVVAYPPSGHFSDINLSADVQRIYVAGGVGITPFLSMILYNLESHSNLPMALFYGARTKADLVFHEYLLFLSNRFKNFKYFPNISTQDPSWSDSPRFIDLSYIQQKIAYNENSHFYFCGPSQMTDSLIQALQNAQFNTSHIHNEKFIY